MKQTNCTNCKNAACVFKYSHSSEWLEKFTCKKGQYIFREKMPVTGLYVVQKGRIEEFYLNQGKAKKTVHTATSGEIFGHMDYSGLNHSHNAIATENTQICFFNKKTLYKVCQSNSELSLNLINFFLDELNKFDNKHLIYSDTI